MFADSPQLPDDANQQVAYQVELPYFSGPMDLLLSLIEQEDLEITAISLARVTDQYLAYIDTLQKITPDILTDFLVVAARLILLKSQVLLPKPPAGIIEDVETESTDDLVQQLKDYKRFKQLAANLDQTQQVGRRNFVRVAPPPKIEAKLNLGDVTVDDLLQAVRNALAVKPEPPEVGTVVSRENISIGQKIRLIHSRLSGTQRLNFNDLLRQNTSRVEIIVTLLAVLELIKSHAVDVEQTTSFGDITIIPKADNTLSAEDWEKLSQMSDLS